jgi:glycosyltransferase involved in cell wall biosynthesis
MKHLIVSREYPPAPYPPGGIGTYVRHVSQLLAECGEEVHVIAQRWREAPAAVEELCGGRLVVHRVDEEPGGLGFDEPGADENLEGLLGSAFPNRWFSWRAARLAERLVEEEGIDVIEAQEWEAPLYDFQLRRALGRGPRRTPPCIVHLHSPTEFIFLHNGWDLGRREYLPMKRLEDYTIAAADARLAPSRFLARQCEQRYGLPAGSTTVLPHPVGDAPVIDRPEATWSEGTICFVGRLEPRKGVVEWVEAAVQVLADHPGTRLEFVGADLYYGCDGGTVRQHAERQIPDRLRDRFAFRGVHDRAGVRQFLAGAWAAVVPSRWENFPYACIEAMASGLPVIASRRGGMADMLEDGRTGWLASEDAGTLVEGLQDALERALATPPVRRSEMGCEAAAAIRRMCDNTTAIRKHIDFRAQVAGRPAVSSIQVPSSAAFARLSAQTARPRRKAVEPMRGLAVVVVCLEPAETLVGCLESVRRQTLPPCAVALVVGPDCAVGAGHDAIEGARKSGWLVVDVRGRSAAVARKAGIAVVQDAVGAPGGWVFLDPHCRLRPGCLEAYHRTLSHCPEVGLVSSWQRRSATGGIDVAPCPALPYQWLVDDAVPSSAFREEALRGAGGLRRAVGPAYQEWDAANRVLAGGWAAVTYPSVLSDVDGLSATTPDPERLRTWHELLEHFPDWVGRDASEILLLQACGIGRGQPPEAIRPAAPGPRELLRRPLKEQITYLATALRHPRRAASWMKRHLERVLRDRTERARWAAANRSR